MIFICHSWGDLALIFTSDKVTRENHCQITLFMSKKSLFMVTRALFFLYVSLISTDKAQVFEYSAHS